MEFCGIRCLFAQERGGARYGRRGRIVNVGVGSDISDAGENGRPELRKTGRLDLSPNRVAIGLKPTLLLTIRGGKNVYPVSILATPCFSFHIETRVVPTITDQ